MKVVVRSYGGDNRKGRPSFYDKDVALASILRATDRVDADLYFVNDGPIPPHRLETMAAAGEIIPIPGGPVGMRDSYRFALDLPSARGWADDDVVSFHEDDYLLAADAFVALGEAARGLPGVAYFALAGVRPTDIDDPVERKAHQTPRGWRPAPDADVAGRAWIHVMSTTSTFAARVGALAADRDVFEQCMRPFRRRFLDHETCLLYQGVVPYHGAELLTGLPGDFDPAARGLPRALLRTLVLVPYRIGLGLRARQQREPHLLYAPAPPLATHMEIGGLAPGRDWATEAADVRDWARRAGLAGAVG